MNAVNNAECGIRSAEFGVRNVPPSPHLYTSLRYLRTLRYNKAPIQRVHRGFVTKMNEKENLLEQGHSSCLNKCLIHCSGNQAVEIRARGQR